jgi:prepilin-type N-terminal cleavage/methylation domain-containing protein
LGNYFYFFKWAPTAVGIHGGESRLCLKFNNRGFSLIEIAIVMVIIGVLAGGSVSMVGILTKRKARIETIDYLNSAMAALISFADINGRLPWADTNGDGTENSGAASGNLPYQSLRLSPTDPYNRTLRYELNANLGSNLSTSCTALKSGLTGGPEVVDADGAGSAFPIAAILVSAGTQDADSDGNVFDDIIAGIHQGDNSDGNPNYIRHPSVNNFDDLVVYMGENELYGKICEFLALAINNASGATVYVYDSTQGADLGSLNDGNSAVYEIMSRTQIEIRSAPGGAGGGGSIIASIPPNPIALSGRGCTINIPSP